jgi:hypothetical protein
MQPVVDGQGVCVRKPSTRRSQGTRQKVQNSQRVALPARRQPSGSSLLNQYRPTPTGPQRDSQAHQRWPSRPRRRTSRPVWRGCARQLEDGLGGGTVCEGRGGRRRVLLESWQAGKGGAGPRRFPAETSHRWVSGSARIKDQSVRGDPLLDRSASPPAQHRPSSTAPATPPWSSSPQTASPSLCIA